MRKNARHRTNKNREYKRIVVRFDKLVRVQLGYRWNVPILSRKLGVSARTLHRVFRSAVETSPLQYLIRVRFMEARRIFLSRKGATAMICITAKSVGFLEVGRFAGQYKAMFGELPSQTQRRARS